MWSMDWGLVGDIGGTNARFALVTPAQALTQPRSFLCEDYETFGDAIAAYLAAGDGGRPSRAVLAVAATTTGDQITLTNHPWTFSVADLKARFSLDRLVVINDFYANALAVPRLLPRRTQDRRRRSGPRHAHGRHRSRLGPWCQRRGSARRRLHGDRRRGRSRHHGGGRRRGKRGPRADAQTLRPRLGRARPIRARARQSLQRPVRARRKTGRRADGGANLRPANGR